MPAEDFITVHFPLSGIDVGVAYSAQPPRDTGAAGYARSTADAENVRGWEPSQDRCRGGSRSGLVKVVSGLVGTVPGQIQALGVVIDPVADALSSAVQSYYPPGDYNIDGGAYPYPNPNDDTGITNDDGVPDPSTNSVYATNGGPVSPPPAPLPDPEIDPNRPDVRNPGRRLPHRGGLSTHSRHRPRKKFGDTSGWPSDQMIRMYGWKKYNTTAGVMAPGAGNLQGFLWNGTTGSGWRGPTFPAPFFTSPKGLIITPSSILGVGGASSFTQVSNAIRDLVSAAYQTTLRSYGWYVALHATQDDDASMHENQWSYGIPSESFSGDLPVVETGGDYGKIALVTCLDVIPAAAVGQNPASRPYVAQQTLFPPTGYSLVHSYPVAGDPGNDMGVWVRNAGVAAYANSWKASGGGFQGIEVLSISVRPTPASEYTDPGQVAEANRDAAAWADWNSHTISANLYAGVPNVTITQLTLDYPTLPNGGGVRPGVAEAYYGGIDSWLRSRR